MTQVHELQPCMCGNTYLAIRTDIYKDKREFIYCDCCGAMATRTLWQAAHTPASQDKALLKQALDALLGVLDNAANVQNGSISDGLNEVIQCRDAMKALRAALAQPAQPAAVQPQAVPDGMCWVPMEPTQAMIDYADKTVPTIFSIGDEYRAMIAAHLKAGD